ncbi:hypothetical protein Angca_005268, partial [Angiostrongylus cantonensis]
VEALRAEKYDSGNQTHVEKMLELWRLLRPDDHISSCSGRHWRIIGFQVSSFLRIERCEEFDFVYTFLQSDDPSRDFRGMGILSLEQLIYMAKFEPKRTRSILLLSNHPRIGFPLVITAINITSLCHHLLKEGLLKNHFRNSVKNFIRIEDFHDAYCHVFTLFVEFWKKMDPPSILNFNNVRMHFEDILFPQLRKQSSQL